jgi:Flp pilus assembly protein TadG
MDTGWLTTQTARQAQKASGRGRGAVQVALVAVVLLMVLYGIVEISRLLIYTLL